MRQKRLKRAAKGKKQGYKRLKGGKKVVKAISFV
jgi:hypothetical protein